MTNRDLARRFADVHPHFLYDAVILEGVVAGGRVHGRIFFDKRGRHLDDTIVSTSSILEAFAGGRVIRTRNSQYLVQMQPETEQRRREASLEPESLEVDPVALHAHFDQANDALAVQPAPVIEASPFREVAVASAERFDRYALRDGPPEAGPYSIGSGCVNGLSKLIEEAGEVVQVAGKVIGLGGLGVHFDGSDLERRLEEELADLLAAIDFVIVRNGLDRGAIGARRIAKRDTFEEWNADASAGREAA